jgi:hypothetical protein
LCFYPGLDAEIINDAGQGWAVQTLGGAIETDRKGAVGVQGGGGGHIVGVVGTCRREEVDGAADVPGGAGHRTAIGGSGVILAEPIIIEDSDVGAAGRRDKGRQQERGKEAEFSARICRHGNENYQKAPIMSIENGCQKGLKV